MAAFAMAHEFITLFIALSFLFTIRHVVSAIVNRNKPASKCECDQCDCSCSEEEEEEDDE